VKRKKKGGETPDGIFTTDIGETAGEKSQSTGSREKKKKKKEGGEKGKKKFRQKGKWYYRTLG